MKAYEEFTDIYEEIMHDVMKDFTGHLNECNDTEGGHVTFCFQRQI
jgi:hypothetical protein